ncbi:MAG: alpha/beta hydrolase [Chloroflexota bacterium]|nr:alpha/beta hydrolase [Chloroflexota bacterium]
MLQRRWTWRLPQRPAARLTFDVPFWTIPGADRTLRCAIWQPPRGVPPSGVAYLYFHGSGWYILDKDVGTRRLFRHLAAQGHVVMDVAYRLYPEVDLMGMLGDVKRVVAWMKANAGRFDVDPARIVVGGGSAGGQLALLAAYAPQHPDLTPLDVVAPI